jgi:hypothetical protein
MKSKPVWLVAMSNDNVLRGYAKALRNLFWDPPQNDFSLKAAQAEWALYRDEVQNRGL